MIFKLNCRYIQKWAANSCVRRPTYDAWYIFIMHLRRKSVVLACIQCPLPINTESKYMLCVNNSSSYVFMRVRARCVGKQRGARGARISVRAWNHVYSKDTTCKTEPTNGSFFMGVIKLTYIPVISLAAFSQLCSGRCRYAPFGNIGLFMFQAWQYFHRQNFHKFELSLLFSVSVERSGKLLALSHFIGCKCCTVH